MAQNCDDLDLPNSIALNSPDAVDPAHDPQLAAFEVLHISAADFIPTSSATTFEARFLAGTSSVTGFASATDTRFMYASVKIPQGKSIKTILAYFYDSSTGRSPVVRLRRTRVWTGVTETLATLTTPQNGETIQTPTTSQIQSPVVDNLSYNYFLLASLFGSDTQIFRVNVYFE